MDRRKFVFLLSSAAGVCAAGSVPTSEPRSKTTIADGCGICGATAVFDAVLDINICLACGAHETAQGWERR